MREAIHGEFQGKTHTHTYPYPYQDREAQISFFPFNNNNNNNKNFPNFLFSLIWLVRVLEL